MRSVRRVRRVLVRGLDARGVRVLALALALGRTCCDKVVRNGVDRREGSGVGEGVNAVCFLLFLLLWLSKGEKRWWLILIRCCGLAT